MAEGTSSAVPTTLSRQVYRGLVVGFVVGVVTTVVSVGPALFIQSVFIGSAQRCEERQRFEEAALDEVQTSCEEDLGDTPFWFPVLVIAVGGSAGFLGGLVYGFLTVPPPRRKRRSRYSPMPQGGAGPGGAA